MAEINSCRVNVNGLDIHYYTCGQGEPLLIIHGGSEGAKAWRSNIAVLSRQYTIYVPDLPGFGTSQSMPGPYGFGDLEEFIDKFTSAIGLHKFYLMGHSCGGGIAVHYALKHPDKIKKLVLVSSLCLGKEIAWWVRISGNPVVCSIAGRAAISLFKGIKYIARYFGPWEIIEPVTRTSIQVGSRLATLTRQTVVLLSQLPMILVPTLVMWGADDPVVPSAQAYAAAELIPDCQLKVFEDCGHSVYREKLRDFSKTLALFLG